MRVVNPASGNSALARRASGAVTTVRPDPFDAGPIRLGGRSGSPTKTHPLLILRHPESAC